MSVNKANLKPNNPFANLKLKRLAEVEQINSYSPIKGAKKEIQNENIRVNSQLPN